MSYETTMARAELRAREQDWAVHRHHCPACSRKAGCTDGTEIKAALREARIHLDRERELDALPAPGQEPLS
ncbi:MAG TPA: hypothetical protein VEH31_19435 [Streptosporangiaceae bacterium]|nr:hypothetical protein [Streptosporangiaceae bacterium]